MLAGKADGSFAAPAGLLDKSGRVLRLGQYWDHDAKAWKETEGGAWKSQLGIAAVPVDWDHDGDLDLVIGSNEGGVYVRLNEGTRAKYAFATESIRVDAAKGPMQVPGNHAIPAIADWDGDGAFDIVSGGGDGGVVWFRNTGKKGAPAFGPAVPLVEVRASRGTLTEPTWPGKRTQVCAADFDADGDLDLLVGDYNAAPYEKGKDSEMHGWVWLFRRR